MEGKGTYLSLEAVARKVKGKEKAGPNPAKQFLPPLPVEQHSAHNTSDSGLKRGTVRQGRRNLHRPSRSASTVVNPQSGGWVAAVGFFLSVPAPASNQSTREEGEREKRREASADAD